MTDRKRRELDAVAELNRAYEILTGLQNDPVFTWRLDRLLVSHRLKGKDLTLGADGRWEVAK